MRSSIDAVPDWFWVAVVVVVIGVLFGINVLQSAELNTLRSERDRVDAYLSERCTRDEAGAIFCRPGTAEVVLP